jgi:hypothetical protein
MNRPHPEVAPQCLQHSRVEEFMGNMKDGMTEVKDLFKGLMRAAWAIAISITGFFAVLVIGIVLKALHLM